MIPEDEEKDDEKEVDVGEYREGYEQGTEDSQNPLSQAVSIAGQGTMGGLASDEYNQGLSDGRGAQDFDPSNADKGEDEESREAADEDKGEESDDDKSESEGEESDQDQDSDQSDDSDDDS
jgi:hypothetical protein